jgi:hypothetical protein
VFSLSYVNLPGGKKLSKMNREERKTTEIQKLENEILELKGKKREEAMKTYRRLLLALADKPIYLMRS